jgi:prevent-host-death family protein
MAKQVPATDAKNNFGRLLEDVATLGRVDIVRHGRLVAIVLSPRALRGALNPSAAATAETKWAATHMIPPDLARAARMVKPPRGFDDD